MRLLIVADHEPDLARLRRQLENEGHDVVTAADGVEARALLGAQRFDGVVAPPSAYDVTATLRAEMTLHESEAGLRRAQEVAQMAHAVVNLAGEVESRSETFATLLDVDAAKLPRTIDEWLAYVHPEDRHWLLEAAATTRRTGGRSDVEYRIRRGNDWRHLRHIVEVLDADDAGHGRRTFNTLQDVTAERQAQEKIRQLSRVHAVLSAINALIVRAVDRIDLLEQTCRILIETGHFAKAWIGLVDEGLEPVRIMAWAGAEDAYFEDLQRRLTAAVGGKAGVLTRAVAGGKPIVSNDIAADERVQERAKLVGSGSLSMALFPLRVDGRTVGVVSIHAPIVGFFDDKETALLCELANDVAFALDHLMKADRIAFLGNHDALTGLPNRALFAELLGQQLVDAGDDAVCVALLDLVRFRRVNETLGRRAGDDLLVQVAARLRVLDPLVARLGPDVFALRFANRSSGAELAREFEHVVSRCFDRPFQLADEELRVGCRIGAAVFPGDGRNAETLLTNAESALRRARATAAPFVLYEPGMNSAANVALAMESRLRRAIAGEEFVLHYQPKVRLADRRICGVEALIRWQDPERGLVPPTLFIPVLEETGLIGIVGGWALRQALADVCRWQSAGAPPVTVAVNVSPLQLNQENFPALVAELIGECGGSALELEITESVIMDDVDRKVAMLSEIRRLGVGIAVDDFGTGYSSLSYIARLPITSLKIDRTFVTAMTSGPEGQVLVSSIIALAHALKFKVIAEGVETAEQAALLTALECDEAQGYLYSRPVPAAQLQELLLAGRPL